MKLFEIDQETWELKLNKPWLWMIPEFNALLLRDKGSEGDSQGRKKLIARKELAYIYLTVDFASPIRDWEEAEKHKEALRYTDLTDKDIDEKVKAAKVRYEQMFFAASRTLKTYKVLQKTLNATDIYFGKTDEVDKHGNLVHDVGKIPDMVAKARKMHRDVAAFAKLVEEELTQGTSTIRGQNELGDREGRKIDSNWSESDVAAGSRKVAGKKSGKTFATLGHTINGTSKQKGLLGSDRKEVFDWEEGEEEIDREEEEGTSDWENDD